MARATWNGEVIAESDETIVIEGNHYFPRDTVRAEVLSPSRRTSRCPWKGKASYFHIEVGGSRNRDAAWTYEDPKQAAAQIRGYVAFWKGVRIEA